MGLGTKWQKPQAMPTQYGRTKFFVIAIARITEVAASIPLLLGGHVESRFGEQPQAGDPAELAAGGTGG